MDLMILLAFACIAFTQTSANGICSKTKANVAYSSNYGRRVVYYAQYYSYGCGWWSRCSGYTRRSYYQTYTYSTSFNRYSWQYYCCDGYSGSVSTGCKPQCLQGCIYGDCILPGTCKCDSGWNGYSCGNDVNECLTSNGGCDQSCYNTAGSYLCFCRNGFKLKNDSHGCEDVNECLTNNGGCDQLCNNTVGSYTCSCGDGYRLNNDNHTCEDIDECTEELVSIGKPAQNYAASGSGDLEMDALWCEQICNNTIGSFECACEQGYYLDDNNRTCIDIDECSTANGGCDHTCHNTNGSYFCTCNEGFLLQEDQTGCADVDECLTNNGGCDQLCDNTVGSYVCSCEDGYRLLRDDHECEDINECAEGLVLIGKTSQNFMTGESGDFEMSNFWCEQICNNTIGSFECVCEQGYYLDDNNETCSDIDECAIVNGQCDHTCHNTNGSYYCTCNEGFFLLEDQKGCKDIDECLIGNGNCDQLCFNTFGSYICICQDGYRLNSDNHTCEDINECAEGLVFTGESSLSSRSNNNTEMNFFWCEQICNNTIGSFECACEQGYYLEDNNEACSDIDECTTANGGCNHACHNTNGSYYCTCREGFFLAEDQKGCEDYDECLNNTHRCDHVCHNTPGGYLCSCHAGFRLEGGTSCSDIDECEEGSSGCSDLCHNEIGSFSCSCYDGYQLSPENNATCHDINECESSNGDCAHVCVNQPGSYHCQCKEGYSLSVNAHDCHDIDECTTANGNCDHTCHNTNGSYYCTCNGGFFLLEDQRGCKDHDECANSTHQCDHICHNTHGGYNCSCFTGFRLHGLTSCTDIDECAEGSSSCSDLCHNEIGSFHCSCYDGYQLSAENNATCYDINECEFSNGGCAHLCANQLGSYQCQCRKGYILAINSYDCYDVNECLTNTDDCDQLCNNTVGSYVCSCENGYRLQSNNHTCEDINECTEGLVSIGEQANYNFSVELIDFWCEQKCINTNGSFECACEQGYFLENNNKTCSDIDECIVANGQCGHTCHNTNGSYYCTCNEGFLLKEDQKGCKDKDECLTNAHQCDHVCHNTHGGYVCSCYPGFSLRGLTTCRDIDECAEGSSSCSDICHNDIGSFHCSCYEGYQLVPENNVTCLDINECEFSNGGCAHLCMNQPGSYQCQCTEGYSLANNAHDCNDVNECLTNNGGCDQFCQNTIASYVCSCGDGYTLQNDSYTCEDIDECTTANGGCNHTCHNTNGSYFCTCREGFVLLEDQKGCTDHDECLNNTHKCDHICQNTHGGYRCSCYDGFSLQGLTTCIDIDECADGSSGCSDICHNDEGSFHCSCYEGYQLQSEDNTRCSDINECDSSNGGCAHVCVNQVGSYLCQCRAGYLLANNTHDCYDINECDISNGGCGQLCHNTNGTYTCSCGNGYKLQNDNHACEDIDECTIANGGCNHTCHNTNGSYYCTCNEGYFILEDEKGCTDHDECFNNTHQCDHVCHNIRGGYHCSCFNGFRLQGLLSCADIDECAEGSSGCSDLCHNEIGSFHCSCYNGYHLSPENNSTCHDIDECESSNGGCAHLCVNQLGTYQCQCRDGYSLAVNAHNCSDIDECGISNGGCTHLCINQPGSYQCLCSEGYLLAVNAHDCYDVNECHTSNGGCDQICYNTVGSYTCSCGNGYRLQNDNHTCEDINECTDGLVTIGNPAQYNISGETSNSEIKGFWCEQICYNTLGSFGCACEEGYYLEDNNETCSDIDECTIANGGCDHTCHNTNGSYYCTCNEGFLLLEDQRGCKDLDECLTNAHQCDHVCHNTYGGYNCSCNAGFSLQGLTSCTDIDECVEGSSGCSDICHNEIGSFDCSCYDGYQLSAEDNLTCHDINECESSNGGCAHVCANQPGSYHCQCRAGYSLAIDSRGCYGKQCTYLTSPSNGNMKCTGPQVTDQNCSFSCHPGYTLSGSSERICLANHTWSGEDTTCKPMKCTELTPSANALVVFPCDSDLLSSCIVICDKGYQVKDQPGVKRWTQTCAVNNGSNTVEWTDAMHCTEMDVCHSNPCYPGRCSTTGKGEIDCDCEGTFRTGDRCEITYVNISPFEILEPNKDYEITVTSLSSLKRHLFVNTSDISKLLITENKKLTIPKSSEEHSGSFWLHTNSPGIYRVSYAVSPSNAVNIPEDSIALVMPITFREDRRNYFDVLGLDKGILSPGCCTATHLRMKPPSCRSNIFFSSSCEWTSTGTDVFSSKGVIFVGNHKLSLPLSIFGASINISSPFYASLPFNFEVISKKCLACDQQDTECLSTGSSVFFDEFDTKDLLSHQSLLQTVLFNIRPMFPSWLSVNAWQRSGTPLYSVYDYSSSLVLGRDLKMVKGCESFSIQDEEKIFYVLRTAEPLHVKVDHFNAFVHSTASKPLCIVIDMCQDVSPQVLTLIPSSLQPSRLESLQYFQYLLDENGELTLKQLILSEVGMKQSLTNDEKFWSGIEYFMPVLPTFEFEVHAKMKKLFKSKSTLKVGLAFEGSVFHVSQLKIEEEKVPGMMKGEMQVNVSTIVGGSLVHMEFHSHDKVSLFSFPGSSVSTQSTLPPGISFKISMKHHSLSLLGLVLISYDWCNIDGFLSLDTSLTVNSFSISSDCLQLKIGQLQLPKTFHHVLQLHGQTKVSEINSVESLTIYSKLKTSAVTAIGDFFEIYTTDENAYDMELAFNSERGYVNGLVYNSNISIFDTELNGELLINDSFFSFQGSITIFNKLDVDVFGVSSTQSSADSMSLQITAEIVDRFNSFKTDLARSINSHAKSEFSIVVEARKNAEIAFQNADDVYRRLLAKLVELGEQKTSIHQRLQESNKTLQYWNTILLNAELALKQFLTEKSLHSEEECENECEKDINCTTCYYKTEVQETRLCQVPVIKKRSIIEHRIVEVRGQRYETRCYPCWKMLWFLLPYYSSGTCCSTESVEYVRFRQEPHETSQYFLEAEINACTSNIYNQTVAKYCCEDTTCSVSVQNISCLATNFLIRSKIKENNVDSKGLLAVYTNYSMAKETFSLSKMEENMFEKKLFALNIEYKITNDTKKNAFLAREARREARDHVFQNTEDYFLLFNSTEYSMEHEQFIKIHNVTFDVVLTSKTPIFLPVKFMFEHEDQMSEITVVVNFQSSLETIHRQVAEIIVSHILDGRRTRQRRENVDQAPLENTLSSICADIKNIQSFFSQISASLETSLAYHMSAVSALVLNNSVAKEYDIADLSFPYFQELKNSLLKIRDAANVSIENMKKFLEDYSFFQWQTSTDFLLKSGSNRLGLECFSLVDCIHVGFYDIVNVLEDTPLTRSTAIKQSVLSMKENLLAIGLNHNYSYADAQSVTKNFLKIFQNISNLNYWCSDAPVIIKQPNLEINITEGETLEIECSVHSLLPVQYFWRRNSKLLDSRTSTLRVPSIRFSDGGKYYCTAVNDAGSTSSLSTTVNVYSHPVMNLTLQSAYETYEGNDNVTRLACDAYSVPLPSWKWFYQSPLLEMWTEVKSANSNVLTIIKPTIHDEGWYKCMAYNQIGNITSRAGYFHVLPAKLSTLFYPIAYSMRLTSLSIPEQLTSDVETSISSALVHLLDLSSTELKNVHVVEETNDTVRVSFILSTPYFDYNKTMNMQEIVAMVASAVVELEAATSNFSVIASSMTVFEIKLNNLELQSIPSSLTIGSRHFSCPNGYGIHSNLILCVGCSPGQYGGREYNDFTILGDGGVLEQVVPQCEECPFGQYANSKLQSRCQECPEHHDTLSKGSTSREECIALCEPHTFSWNGYQPCTPCPQYYYQLEYGRTNCFHCSSSSLEICRKYSMSMLSTSFLRSLTIASSTTIEPSLLQNSFQSSTILITVSTTSVVLIVLIIFALVLVLIFSILNKKNKRIRDSDITQGCDSVELNLYEQKCETKSDTEFSTFEKADQFDESEILHVLNSQPIYDDLKLENSIDQVIPQNEIPDLPPRKLEHTETSSVKSTDDYMPMDATNLTKDINNYEEINKANI